VRNDGHRPAGILGAVEMLIHKIEYEESNHGGSYYSHESIMLPGI